MFIAFDGTDGTGKTNAATSIASAGYALYDLTEDVYRNYVNSPRITTADRVGWITQLTYRLALPGFVWPGATPKAVFPMPEAHLVIKTLDYESLCVVNDPLYNSVELGFVNAMYRETLDYLARLNHNRGYTVFKSVSHVIVSRTANSFSQKLASLTSSGLSIYEPIEDFTNHELVELLRQVGVESIDD